MDVGIAPSYALKANDDDITTIIRDRFVSLSLTDETGENSDKLEIVLADHDETTRIKVPPRGAELALSLGYDGVLVPKGIFVCDGVSVKGFPEQMTIHAHAAPWEQTPKGKSDFQSHKTRSWKAGITIGAMVSKIANEHGMAAIVSPALASVKLPHFDQSEESDMNLLLRVAKKYDAISKPAGGKLIFAKRGDATTASGAALPKIKVDRSDCGAYEWNTSTRESAGTVVAYWHAKRAARRHEIHVGEGEPVKRLKQYFPTQDMALAAARAELARRARGAYTFSVNIPGTPALTAECILDVTGFRDEINGEWLAKRAEHIVNKDGAYRCIVECELPNGNEEVKDTMNGTVSDNSR
ncbi:phage tail protein [Burkholderia ubonensis]|uniref:contractile injection system protein, VgrG/Pvc8 family n=1 Tax=Burkholderia ubonensis TaxID=101571 RepID=UPI00075614B4|nr:contractile injection system protein, VgrG/Pvc8 family [Burkholderia ubonensis]KVG89104.1 phage tail protein [Burkholderia ubonensis]